MWTRGLLITPTSSTGLVSFLIYAIHGLAATFTAVYLLGNSTLVSLHSMRSALWPAQFHAPMPFMSSSVLGLKSDQFGPQCKHRNKTWPFSPPPPLPPLVGAQGYQRFPLFKPGVRIMLCLLPGPLACNFCLVHSHSFSPQPLQTKTAKCLEL